MGQGLDAAVIGEAGAVKRHLLNASGFCFFCNALANHLGSVLVATLAHGAQALANVGFSGRG